MRRKLFEEMLDRRRQRADERRDRQDRLRDRVAFSVSQHDGKVVRFAHEHRKRGAHERGRRFIDHADESLPLDLERNGIELDLFHSNSLIVTATVKSGRIFTSAATGTTKVDSRSSSISGPAIRVPGFSE